MALDILQYPNDLNKANGNLLWVVSSSNADEPQFQYIGKIYSGSYLLTTVKQQPNPNGIGVFDLGRLIRQYLSYDTDTFDVGKTNGRYFHKAPNAGAYFRIGFDEEYGTSSTSIVTPAGLFITGSDHDYYINGVTDPNYGSWDWDTSSKYIPKPAPNSLTFNHTVGLTDSPRTVYCGPTDYMTVAFINSGSSTTAQDIYYVAIDVYLDNFGLIHTDADINWGAVSSLISGGPRTFFNQQWPPASVNQTTGSYNDTLLYCGIGPGNWSSSYDFVNAPWSYYEVRFHPQQLNNFPNTLGFWDKFTVYKQETCPYPRVRFAWINDYGVWDYYNFTLANSKNYQIEKNTYKASFVDYSTKRLVPYNIAKRGTSAFDTKPVENYTVVSDWLTEEYAKYLEPLFYSPSVYIQSGSVMVPVVLTNTEVVTKTNPKSQKLFNYTVNYQPANQLRSR